jgi:hypothetical protein
MLSELQELYERAVAERQELRRGDYRPQPAVATHEVECRKCAYPISVSADLFAWANEHGGIKCRHCL